MTVIIILSSDSDSEDLGLSPVGRAFWTCGSGFPPTSNSAIFQSGDLAWTHALLLASPSSLRPSSIILPPPELEDATRGNAGHNAEPLLWSESLDPGHTPGPPASNTVCPPQGQIRPHGRYRDAPSAKRLNPRVSFYTQILPQRESLLPLSIQAVNYL